MIHHLKRATRHLLIVSVIVLAVGLSLVRLFLWGVEDYKDYLENKFQELTSIPLEVGVLSANMRGFSPEIILKEIKVVLPEGTETAPLQLTEVRVGINLMQLLWTRQILPSSWLTLVGAKLSVVRNEDGSLSIAGLNIKKSKKKPLWLLQGGRYEVLKSEITWLDKQRHALPITFNNVDLSITNDSDSDVHEIHLISQLPEQYGEMLRVSMSVQGNVFAKDNINGLVYVEGQGIHLAKLVTGDLPLSLKISSGEGGFKLWSQWNVSKLEHLSGSITANQLTVNIDNRKLEINNLETDFFSSIEKGRKSLAVTRLDMKMAQQSWPTAQFEVSVNDALTEISASVIQLDLQQSAKIFDFLAPVTSDKQKLVSDLAIKGQLKDVFVFINKDKQSYAINGDFKGVSVNAVGTLPKINNLTASIKGTQSSGQLALNMQDGILHFPKKFRQAHPIKQLQGLVNWQQTEKKWSIETDGLSLDTPDIETQTRFNLILPKDEQADFIDLQTSFSNVEDISELAKYFPVAIMEKDSVDWLDMALVSGKVPEGKLLIYGNPKQRPFIDGEGSFEVLFPVEDAVIKYSPDWPVLNHVMAEVLFLKNSLKVDVRQADSEKMLIKQTLVEIPALGDSDYVFVKGQTGGQIIDVMGFLQQTPIKSSIDDILEVITPEGTTTAEVDLSIALNETLSSTVKVITHLNKAALTVKSINLAMKDIKGDLIITEKGMSSSKVMANTLGYPVEVGIDHKSSGLKIQVIGKTSVSQLKKQFDFLRYDFFKAESRKDSTHYNVLLTLPDNEKASAELDVKMDLVGVILDLPGSLKKTAKQKTSLDVNLVLGDETFLPLRVGYHDALSAAVMIKKQRGGIHSGHIVYGHEQAVMPTRKEFKIQVEQTSLEASEWLGFLSSMDKTGSSLSHISLKANQLLWQGKSYGALSFAMQNTEQHWKGTIKSLIATGDFIFPASKQQRIKLNMDTLNLTEIMKFKSKAKQVSNKEIPLIMLVSEQLWWKGTNLGLIEIETEKLNNGIRFNIINVLPNHHKLDMNIDWLQTATDSSTEINGLFEADDFSQLLADFDIENDFKETQANIDFSAYWPGSPAQFSLKKVVSDIDLELKNGRILSIDPGLGRILGLLAVEQWMKRLTLDFRDIYKKGLSFNSIKGHFKMDSGKLVTKDLLVDAIPAKISIRGEADLQQKTLDNWIRVVPKSSGALPIAGTIVSGIAGVITKAFTNDYKEGYFFGSAYRVTGAWGDIKVTPLRDQDGLLKKTWKGLTDFSWIEPTVE